MKYERIYVFLKQEYDRPEYFHYESHKKNPVQTIGYIKSLAYYSRMQKY